MKLQATRTHADARTRANRKQSRVHSWNFKFFMPRYFGTSLRRVLPNRAGPIELSAVTNIAHVPSGARFVKHACNLRLNIGGIHIYSNWMRIIDWIYVVIPLYNWLSSKVRGHAVAPDINSARRLFVTFTRRNLVTSCTSSAFTVSSRRVSRRDI